MVGGQGGWGWWGPQCPPQGSTIYPVLSSALKDPHYFPDPERFDPQHFLDSEGKFRRCEAFIPFSAGEAVTHKWGWNLYVGLGPLNRALGPTSEAGTPK